MAENYVCTLDTASQEKAEKELNEDAKQRQSALETLRKWLNDRKEWLRVPMDSTYLLGFLRMKKFNQLETRKSIVKAWELKTRFPQWYKTFDPADSKIRAVISSGYYYPLPRRDKNGRKVIIMRYGNISTTTKEYGPDDILKGFITLHEHVIRDENVQVNGYVYFMDLTGFGMKHVTYSGVERFANGADCWMKAHCGRNKELHFYNGGQMFNVLYGLLKQAMPKKIQERVRNHEENLFTVYDYIDKSLLPDEYLPDDYDGPSAGPKSQIIDKYLEEVTSDEYRRYMASMSNGQYFVEASKRPREEEQASFRPIVQ